MRLKRLEVYGFKSFADKTSIHFNQGITAIVGPNGCGKSNVADAFRWVLGEQSARSLRGGKMQDVIFAGTATRRQLNYAEVTVVLDQVADAIAGGYSEVAVTRRLHRSGESEYLLNNQPVRLKDLHSMFLGTGIGKNSFSIIEQGKVERIIQSSPAERRVVFEEAAGIMRFLERKREALRRLDKTQQNIERVHDVHAEVRKQMEVLEKQAAAARAYKDNSRRLEYLEKAVAVAKYDQLALQSGKGKNVEAELEKTLEGLQQQQQGLRQQHQELQVQLAADEEALKKCHEAVFKLESEQRLAANEQKNRQERLVELKESRGGLSQKFKDLEQRDKQRESEVKQVEKALASLESKIDTAQKGAQTTTEALEQQVDAGQELHEQHQQHQQQLVEAVKSEGAVKSELDKLAVQHASHGEAIKAIKDRQKALIKDNQGLGRLLEDKRREMDKVLADVDKGKGRLKEYEAQCKELEEQIKAAEKERETLRARRAELVARQKVLTRMKEAMEGLSSGAKEILKESGRKGSTIHGTVQGLYELLTIPKGNETLAATALAPHGETLVVNTRKELDAVLALAAKKELKDFALFCLEDVVTPPKMECETLAVKSADKLAKHFLGHVGKVSGVEDARQLLKEFPSAEALIGEGLLYDYRGVVTSRSLGEDNVFQREAEMQEVAKELKGCEKALAKSEEGIQKLDKQRQGVNKERLELDQKVRRGEMGLVEANLAIQQTTTRQSEAEKNLQKLEEEEAAKVKLQQEVAQQQELKKEEHGQAAKILKEAQKRVQAFEGKVTAHRVKVQKAQEKHDQAQAVVQTIKAEQQQCQHKLEVLAVQARESVSQKRTLADEQAAAEALEVKIRQQQDQDKNLQTDLTQMVKDSVQRRKEAEKTVSTTKQAMAKVDKQVADLGKQQKRMEKDFYQAGTALAQLQTSQESVAKELKERFDLTIEQVRDAEPALEGSVEAAEKEVRKLRQQIHDAGDINMTSIEEFDKGKERHEFFVEQIGDLEQGKDELMEIIQELDGECRDRFGETFNRIQENFRKNFSLLFRGGEADLVLVDSDDVLEAGVEIIAKPPGKKMRSIQLLSGGEKCLTAIALLFSIFEVRPAPFCILDEIDAPLDDSNVTRFVDVVKQFIDKCQFLIITHNKVTMAIANTIFGVSMEERGVSRLLTMKFSPQEESDVDVGVVEEEAVAAES